MRSATFVAAAIAIVLASSLGALAARVTVERHPGSIPSGWVDAGSPAADSHVDVTFAVRQQNTWKLEETLLRISDPEHPDFNKLLTNDEVRLAARLAGVPQHVVREAHSLPHLQAARSPCSSSAWVPALHSPTL